MAFDAYRTVWRLRPGIKPPFAREAKPTGTKAALQPKAEEQTLGVGLGSAGQGSALAAVSPAPVQTAPVTATSAPGAGMAQAQAAAPSGQQPGTAAAQADKRETPVAGATLYLSARLQLSYLEGLQKFLSSKGIRMERFAGPAAIPDSAVALLGADEPLPPGCRCFVPDENKAALWAFLRRVLPELSA